MAIEEKLVELTKAVVELTAAYKASGGKAAAAATPAAGAKPVGRPPGKAAPAGPSFEELKVAGVKVVDQLGRPKAVALIKKIAGVDALSGVDKSKYAELMKAFEAALEPEEAAEEAVEGDDDAL